nr:replication protein A 70 kDa DNA-binding subunit B [Tanacetum cinerariifolium]
MQATVRMDKLKRYQHHLKEGNALTIQRYSLGETKPKIRMVYNAMRLSFLSNTEVDSCTDFNGSVHGCVWRPFKSITDLEKEEDSQFENTATKISTASKNSTKDTFVNKHPIRNIAELLDVEQGVQSVIVGTMITIQENKGWWYLGCRAYRGKVIKSTDYIDLESEMPKKGDGPNDWWCRKCNAWVALIKSQFHLQIHVQDETGTMSLSLFNDEVQAMVGRSAYQLCEKYAKSESDGSIPTKITDLIGNKYAFKVAIDDYNVKKLLPVFTVLRFSNDQEIINSVLACATPIKDAYLSSASH